MPVQACVRGGKKGYKWGQSGHCYVYTDEASRKKAKQLAHIQGYAAEQSMGEVHKEDELSKAVGDLLEKFNQCHGAKGRFCSGSGGGGGGGGGGGASSSGASSSSDLPSWMRDNKKPAEQPAAAPKVEAKPAYTPGKRLANGTYLPDSNGKYPYPDNYKARLDLKPHVGKEVKMEYWAENKGGKSITNPDLPTRCIKDIKVDGIKAPVHHVWVQEPSKELINAKWGQKQEAIGVITAYAKGKPGEAKTMDYSVQPVRGTVSKGMPIEKFNHCHGPNGRFCSGSGGGGKGGGGAGGASPAAKPADESSITGEELQAVKQYQGADFAFINTWMRNPDNGGNQADGKMYLRKADQIERVIQKQPALKGEEVVYRGLRPTKEMKANLVPGGMISDKGFMSTTTDREVAKNFGNVVMTIRVPKGHKALRMTDLVDTPSAKREKEMLLPRGTKLKITHVREEKTGFLGTAKTTYIEARVVTDE